MSHSRVFSLSLVLSNVLLLGATSAEEPYRHASKISELVQPLVDAQVLQGVAIGIVDGKSRWTGDYGTLSADNSQSPTENTIYEIGSISKVFTGVLLASAVNAGEVKLDDSIGSIVKSISEKNAAVGDSIQLRHLSTHTSGLPRMPGNWSPADQHRPYVDYDRKKMIEFIEVVKPTQTPGEPSGYSNYAVGLLGELLSIKSGKSYQQLLSEGITTPLDMQSTTLQVSEDDRVRFAPPHQSSGEPDYEWELNAFAGAGGIRSTVHDMQRFIDAHLSPRSDDLGKAIELAWEQHLPAQGKSFAMGLGWHIARDGSTRWHNGQTGGYHSMLMINRNMNAGVIVLGNTASGDIDWIGESIIQLLAGIDVKPKEMATIKVPEETLARLEGDYELAPQFVLTVTAKSGRLFVQATNQPQLRVYPDSETKWSYREVDAKLTFELPATGVATALTLHQNGQNMKATRK